MCSEKGANRLQPRLPQQLTRGESEVRCSGQLPPDFVMSLWNQVIKEGPQTPRPEAPSLRRGWPSQKTCDLAVWCVCINPPVPAWGARGHRQRKASASHPTLPSVGISRGQNTCLLQGCSQLSVNPSLTPGSTCSALSSSQPFEEKSPLQTWGLPPEMQICGSVPRL